jgi:hypothetical protein
MNMLNGDAAHIEFLKPPYRFSEPLEEWVDKPPQSLTKQFVRLWVLNDENELYEHD